MKTFLIAVVCALALPLMAAVGDVIPQEKLPVVWFAGEQPQAWPNDDLWIFECWATWCGPCIRAIPHMEELWKTYQSKGVKMVGVNVERNKSQAQLKEFFSKQRVPPTYNQAHDFDNRFADQLKIIGIPFAVAVRNGKIVWQGHPMSLKPATIDTLLQNGKAPECTHQHTEACRAKHNSQ
jgi:thiol-disulfide isomerase/thioredoxin